MVGHVGSLCRRQQGLVWAGTALVWLRAPQNLPKKGTQDDNGVPQTKAEFPETHAPHKTPRTHRRYYCCRTVTNNSPIIHAVIFTVALYWILNTNSNTNNNNNSDNNNTIINNNSNNNANKYYYDNPNINNKAPFTSATLSLDAWLTHSSV